MAAAATLVLAALLAPVAVVTLPGGLLAIGPRPTAVSLVAALLLAPGAVAAATTMSGLAQLCRDWRARRDGEHGHAIGRIFVQVLVLFYAVAVVRAGAAAAPSLLVAMLALVSGWCFLLLAIISRTPSPWRRNAAIALDCALLSALLHFGAAATAACYPLYFAAICCAGLWLGPGALAVSAASGVVGFAAVVATTPFWRGQPGLAAGLVVALAATPAGLALLVRAAARSRAEAAAASAARARFVTELGRGLRAPVSAMGRIVSGAVPAIEADAGEAAPTLPLPARALLSQISEVLDLAAIEAGEFAPAVEAFDLHAIVNDAVSVLRAAAGERGIALALRIDPHLPYRLCGWPRQLAQIVNSLVVTAIAASGAGTLRIEFAADRRDRGSVELRLDIRSREGAAAQPDDDRFGLGVARRLVELMGGRLLAAADPGRGVGWTVRLPLTVDAAPPQAPFDLARHPVLIATEDARLAAELAEPLAAWNADLRWVGGLDDALVYVERFDTPLNPVIIVDGRRRAIPALSFVHRAALARAEPPFVLFIVDFAQRANLAELADGELAALLPAPLDAELLENALHALPLAPAAATAASPAVADGTRPPMAADAPVAAEDGVIPIAAHPRFASETAAVVDARVVASLRALGSGDFLYEVIDSFRADARQIMERVAAAADAADAAGFTRAVHALRRCSATVGGGQLGELAMLLREVSEPELQQQGAAIVQRLGAELARLEAALLEYLPQPGAMRG